MKLDHVQGFNIAKEIAGAASGAVGEQQGSANFQAYLEKSINEVSDLLKAADEKSVEMALGKSENLHDAMITFEKAESALKLLVQVRNKALEAYHEVMRMQV